MALILLVEDDPDQLMLRRMILERGGHSVTAVSTPAEALAQIQSAAGGARSCVLPGGVLPDCVLMDLRLPRAEDGRALIRELKALVPEMPVIVLSGRAQDFLTTPEARQVSATLAKPVRTERLLQTIARIAQACCLAIMAIASGAAQSREFPFQVSGQSEVIAELSLASPGSDWAVRGREAAVASLTLDGAARQQVMVFAGPGEHPYHVFLGSLAPGAHTLRIERDAGLSAAGSGLAIGGARFEALPASDPRALPIAHAPVLFARADTVGRFSDVPLLAYYTRGRDASGPWLEYTIIFSNEDGGTSTRDLMARWGRAADIEYIYRVWLDARGQPAKTLIQTRDHRDLPYSGAREGSHPILIPVTDNNMVEPAGPGASPVRYQLVPVAADLAAGSRESIMDRFPVTYLVSAKELQREAKLRAPGTFQGEKIADPRLYLVVELKVQSENAAVQVVLLPRGSSKWLGSAAGIAKNFIERSGWVRTAIELPPGTALSDLAAIGVECLSRRDLERQPIPKNGRCRVEALDKVFFLGENCAPRPPLVLPPLPPAGWPMRVGEMLTLALP